ncbi:PREDICTED: uncharacterized protein LOC107327878 [Acropora digitifera]|uniref:uncharacterized protein LOC107327878 n=1 Tax=Acropora digitifera TaxID=70779 RepID=UPI00077A356C|nr:PREDICTED: uncharacterized protein LOC107327878 [Acropora digitifera]
MRCGLGMGCSKDEFSCADGGCVSWALTCNGEKDCEDGTDEPLFCKKQGGQIASFPQERRDSAAGPSFCSTMQDSSEDVIEVLSPGEGSDGSLGTAAVSSDDHHTDFNAQFDELPIKPILLHRDQLRQDFVMEFSDPNILNFKLDVTVVDEMVKRK